ANLILAALIFLWICCFINILAQSVPLHLSRWVPAWIRGVTYAIGTSWGITSAASLILYSLVRLATGGQKAEFSPERRSLLRTAGSIAVAAPFAGVAFGGIFERTNFHVKEIDL